MNVEKKQLNDTQLELRVELPVLELQPYVQQAAWKISEHINIPGFRKGRVPYDVLKRHVGEAEIYEQAFRLAVEHTYPEALEREKLEVVGPPRVDFEKLAPGNPLIYKAVVTLLPSVVLGDHRQLEARRKSVAAGDQELDRALQNLREMRAKESLIDRPARKGDRVVVDFTISLDKVVLEGGKAQKHTVDIGRNHYIPGLEEALIGMTKGQEKTSELTFPKEYHQKNLAGKKTELKVKMHEVYNVELPALNDEFAKNVGGFKNVQELKDRLTKNISDELQTKEEQRFELALIEEIVDSSKIGPTPDVLRDSELEKMLHELEEDVKRRGGKFEDYLQNLKKTREDLLKELRPRAEKRIRTALVARAIALKEKLAVTDKEVDTEVETTLKMYGDNPEAKKQFQSPQYRSYVSNFLINRKVFDLLKKSAGVEKEKKK